MQKIEVKSAHTDAAAACLDLLMATGSWRATKYLAASDVVKVTRKKYGYRKHGYTFSGLEFSVTIGRPNFNERRFVKACQKAGEAFPVKKIQLKALPVRKVKS